MMSKYNAFTLLDEVDPSTVLWCYMPAEGLFSILDNKSLFQSPLRSFEDPFEGTYPIWLADYITKTSFKALGYSEMPLTAHLPQRLSSVLKAAYELTLMFYGNMNLVLQKEATYSCWHASNGYSDAMWKIYAKNANGVAIKTTIGELKKAIEKDGKKVVEFYNVNYSDFQSKELPVLFEGADPSHIPLPLLKRDTFSFEMEVRAIHFSEKFNSECDRVHDSHSCFLDELIAAKSERKELHEVLAINDRLIKCQRNITKTLTEEVKKCEPSYIKVKNVDFINEIHISPHNKVWVNKSIKQTLEKRYNIDNSKIVDVRDKLEPLEFLTKKNVEL